MLDVSALSRPVLWAKQLVLPLLIKDAVGDVEGVISPFIISDAEPHRSEMQPVVPSYLVVTLDAPSGGCYLANEVSDIVAYAM